MKNLYNGISGQVSTVQTAIATASNPDSKDKSWAWTLAVVKNADGSEEMLTRPMTAALDTVSFAPPTKPHPREEAGGRERS